MSPHKVHWIIAGQTYTLAEIGEVLWTQYLENNQPIPQGIVNQYLEQIKGTCKVTKEIFNTAYQDLTRLANKYHQQTSNIQSYIIEAKKHLESE